MEDIKIEGFVAEILRGDGTIARAFEERRINRDWHPATLFISKDATPPKVVALEEVLPYMQHKSDCLQRMNVRGGYDDIGECTCGLDQLLAREGAIGMRRL